MRRAAALIVVVAAAAYGEDDPDLFVVSGRAALDADKPADVLLQMQDVHVAGMTHLSDVRRTGTVPPGGTFRFAGLPPGRYDLIVLEEHGWWESRREIDVFGDVADLEVRRESVVLRKNLTAARLAGRVTLGVTPFDPGFTMLEVRDRDGVVSAPDVAVDGSFQCVGLGLGLVWIEVTHARSPCRDPADLVVRRVAVDLKPGDNRRDVRVDPAENVRFVVRSKNAGESIEGRLSDVDSPLDALYGCSFRADVVKDGVKRCYAICGDFNPVWGYVGETLPIDGVARGPHRVKIEAVGFETTEKAFDVDGPTRVDVELTPLAGQYVRLSEYAERVCFLEERRADGSWASIFESGFRPGIPYERRPRPPRVFLAPGPHALRVQTTDAPPSATVALNVGNDRSELAPTFQHGTGDVLAARLLTKSGARIDGFAVHCFRLEGERWNRLHAHDTIAKPTILLGGLAPGSYRLAFDEKGDHVFAEFEMSGADRVLDFTLKRE